MANFTSNYHLTKPAPQDYVNIKDLNDNFDVLDSALKTISDEVQNTGETSSGILDKLKTVDGRGSGLDADLLQGNAVVPVELGGTGAVSTLDARRNLGITAENIGAASAYRPVVKEYITITGSGSSSDDADTFIRRSGYALRLETAPKKFLGGSTTLKVTHNEPVSNSEISFSSIIGSKTSYFNLFGTHNLNYMASQVQKLLEEGKISMVKSLQRGVIQNASQSKTISISSVKMDKSIILAHAHYQTGTSINSTRGSSYYSPAVYLKSSTELGIIGSGNDSSADIYWQIIEFY